jgi:hypothetical protein
MSGFGLPVFATVALGFGPVMFARSFRDLKLRRLIENTPTARIRSLAMGLVELNGEVLPNSMLNAPFSGRSCAFWEIDIATRSGRRNSWSVVHRNASGHPFFLRDETGVALVYPHGAQCRVHAGTEEVCLGISVPEVYASYMSDQGLTARHLWRLSTMRFRERILEEGQMLYVLGTATPRSRALDISDGETLAATGTDDPVASRMRELHDDVTAVIRCGENPSTFILSQGSERQLVTDLGLKAVGELVAGPTMTLFGLGYWLYALSSGSVFH